VFLFVPQPVISGCAIKQDAGTGSTEGTSPLITTSLSKHYFYCHYHVQSSECGYHFMVLRYQDTCLRLYCWAALLSSAVAASVAIPIYAAQEKGWISDQFSETVPTHINYITPHAFKSDASIGGFTIISRAPDWKVTVYNKKSKVFWETPLAQFKGEIAARLYASDRQDLMNCKWEKKKDVQCMGFPCEEYATTGSAKKTPGLRGHVYKGYFLAMPVPVTKEVYALLAKIYQLPILSGLPLKLEFELSLEDQIDHIKGLDTRRIKQAMIDDSEFLVPLNYKRVQTENAVFLDQASQAAMKEFSEWTAPELNLKKPK